MSFSLSDEQLMISDTADRLFERRWDIARAGDLSAAAVVRGDVWGELKSIGMLGIALPEAAGGGGMGAAELSILCRLFGRYQMRSPFIASMVLAGTALSLAPASPLRDSLLDKLAVAEISLAMAVLEGGARYHHDRVETRARQLDHGYTLSGCKRVVIDADLADWFIVSCRLADDNGGDGALVLVALRADTPGVRLENYTAFDGTALSTVHLDNVSVAADALIVGAGQGADILDAVMAQGAFAAASETLGACEAAFDKTLDYMRTREQFGQTLASFQALQHRASDLHADIEMLRSLVQGASLGLDADEMMAGNDAHGAMAMAVTVGDRVCREAIHMHGGIGMTQDLGVGRYLLRVNALSRLFGDATYNARRYLNSMEE